MKSSPEVENVNQESLFLVTRATVSFEKDFDIPEKQGLINQSVIISRNFSSCI